MKCTKNVRGTEARSERDPSLRLAVDSPDRPTAPEHRDPRTDATMTDMRSGVGRQKRRRSPSQAGFACCGCPCEVQDAFVRVFVVVRAFVLGLSKGGSVRGGAGGSGFAGLSWHCPKICPGCPSSFFYFFLFLLSLVPVSKIV